MSGAIGRHLARATGVAKPRLRPRIPARFENAVPHTETQPLDPGGGFRPLTPASPDAGTDPDIRDGAATETPEPLPLEAIAHKAASGPPRRDTTSDPTDVRKPVAPAVGRAADGGAVDGSDTRRMPTPRHVPEPLTAPRPPADQTDFPAPPQPEESGPRASVPQERMHAPGPDHPPFEAMDPHSPKRTVEVASPVAKPPDPLLERGASDAPRAPLEPLEQTQAQMPFAPASQPPSSPVQTSEPDIEIHIGRIELRGPAAAPAQRKARADRPPRSAVLGEYLKGRGR